jgi:HSP20 family molecular chaperone IbpA
MLDIDSLLSELERTLLAAARLLAEGGGPVERTLRLGLAGNVEVSSSLRVGFLDEMAETAASRASRPALARKPVVDLIETKEGFKVLVHLPGVKPEDIRVAPRPGFIAFEITTRGKTYRREVPCDIPPSKVSIESIVENNSVVEITFARKGKVARR